MYQSINIVLQRLHLLYVFIFVYTVCVYVYMCFPLYLFPLTCCYNDMILALDFSTILTTINKE